MSIYNFEILKQRIFNAVRDIPNLTVEKIRNQAVKEKMFNSLCPEYKDSIIYGIAKFKEIPINTQEEMYYQIKNETLVFSPNTIIYE